MNRFSKTQIVNLSLEYEGTLKANIFPFQVKHNQSSFQLHPIQTNLLRALPENINKIKIREETETYLRRIIQKNFFSFQIFLFDTNFQIRGVRNMLRCFNHHLNGSTNDQLDNACYLSAQYEET